MTLTVVLSSLLSFPVQAIVITLVVVSLVYLLRQAAGGRCPPMTFLRKVFSYVAAISMTCGTFFIAGAVVMSMSPASLH